VPVRILPVTIPAVYALENVVGSLDPVDVGVNTFIELAAVR